MPLIIFRVTSFAALLRYVSRHFRLLFSARFSAPTPDATIPYHVIALMLISFLMLIAIDTP